MISEERLRELWLACGTGMGGAITFARAVEAKARKMALEEAIAACTAERVDSVCDADDAYNRAIGHCAAAIRALQEKT